MEQNHTAIVQKEKAKQPTVPAVWWNERHLAVLFVICLSVTVVFNGW